MDAAEEVLGEALSILPLAAFLREDLVAWRDLKPLFFCFHAHTNRIRLGDVRWEEAIARRVGAVREVRSTCLFQRRSVAMSGHG